MSMIIPPVGEAILKYRESRGKPTAKISPEKLLEILVSSGKTEEEALKIIEDTRALGADLYHNGVWYEV